MSIHGTAVFSLSLWQKWLRRENTKAWLDGLHEPLVGGVLIGLVGEVGHVNHLEALTVACNDITHSEVHDVRLHPLLQLWQETRARIRPQTFQALKNTILRTHSKVHVDLFHVLSVTCSFLWPVADGSDVRESGKQPVPVLSGQQHPQLFGLDKMFDNNVQTPAVGGLWGHHFKSHLQENKKQINKSRESR